MGPTENYWLNPWNIPFQIGRFCYIIFSIFRPIWQSIAPKLATGLCSTLMISFEIHNISFHFLFLSILLLSLIPVVLISHLFGFHWILWYDSYNECTLGVQWLQSSVLTQYFSSNQSFYWTIFGIQYPLNSKLVDYGNTVY